MKNNMFLASDRVLPWSIFFLSCIVYVSSINYVSGGDAIYYANIIDTLRFDQLTAHQFYYLLGFLCKHLFGWLFGLTTDQSLAIMSALFGGASLCVGYLLLECYLKSKKDALLGTLILFLCNRFYVNATSTEIYIVQTFFIWSSYLFFENRRFYRSGLFFALALWTSPLTLAYALFFPAVAYLRKFGIQSLIRVAIPVVLVYAPFLLFFYKEMLWGVRGVINQDEARQIDLALCAYDVFRYQIKHYSFLNLLLVPAILAIREQKLLFWITIAVALPNVYVISQLRGEENVFILTLDVFFSCWFMLGWRVLRVHSLAWLAVVLLIAHGIIFMISDRPFLAASNKTYGDEIREIGDIIHRSGNSIAFADWSRRMALVYYNRSHSSYPLEQGYWYDASFDIDNLYITNFNKVAATPEQFDKYDEVFVLESYSPSQQAKLFLDEDTLKERYEHMSERRRLERFLHVQCHPVRTGILVLYRCR